MEVWWEQSLEHWKENLKKTEVRKDGKLDYLEYSSHSCPLCQHHLHNCPKCELRDEMARSCCEEWVGVSDTQYSKTATKEERVEAVKAMLEVLYELAR